MPVFTSRFVFLLLIGVLVTAALQTARAEDPLIFISAFADGDEAGIHAFRLDLKSGVLKPLHRTTGVDHPFFLALSPDNRFLYSIHAPTFSGKDDEHVAGFELIGRTGQLKPLNRQSSRGTASCYLDVDATGKSVLVSNYTSGSVAALPIRPDGSLGEPASFIQHVGSSINPARQKEPHAHCIVISPDNRFAYVADLGLDQILCYRLDPATAKLTPHRQAFVRTLPGAGPRHLTFHPNGKSVYVINELTNSVTHFDYEAATGNLYEQKTIPTLPADFTGVSHCADLKITPDGKFLYGTNRGHDSLAAYKIADDGSLTLIEIQPSLGGGPQNLAITLGGELLICVNMPGKNVAVFRIDATTGKLASVGDPVAIPSPSCIMLVP